MIYAYLPLIAVVVLTIRFVALPHAPVRSKWIIGGAALASLAAFPFLPTWRSFVLLLQIAFSVYLIFYLKVVSDAD